MAPTLRIYVVKVEVNGRLLSIKARGSDEASALQQGVVLAKARYKTEDVVGISATLRECQFC